MNVISWSGRASVFTFPKHTRKKARIGNVHYRQSPLNELAGRSFHVEERTTELTRANAELERRVEAGASDYLAKPFNTDSS